MLAVAAGALLRPDRSTIPRDAYRTVSTSETTCSESELDPNPQSHLVVAQNALFQDKSDTN